MDNPPRAAAAEIASFAATIFASSSLLFLIQPMLAKQMLPWFGGGASVWTTCLVFYQSLLLLGYLYAHGSVRRLSRRWQAILHLVLLAAGVIVIFLPTSAQARPAAVSAPVYESLRLLVRSIGLPYFLLSSTTPLLQAWYARTTRAVLPYRLFALSNLASLLALMAYPFAVEPLAGLESQMNAWRALYAGFTVLCGLAAVLAFRKPGEIAGDASAQPEAFRWHGRRSLTWIALSACSCALLMAVTNGLSQNIAPVPLLWIAPLALYLISFVLCFNRDGMFKAAVYRLLVPLALIGLIWTNAGAEVGVLAATGLCLACLFVLCMFCHAQLSALKPGVGDLTSFYLCVSAGGAIGGIFVGLLAPALFSSVFELQITVSACLVLSLRCLYDYRSRVFLLACGILAITALWTVQVLLDEGTVTWRGRNFYGALAVREAPTPAFGGSQVRTLLHGRVLHGGQVLSEAARREPTFYYGRESGGGIALARPMASHRAGVVGLGAGTLASYGRPGDYYRFYELDPLVAQLARSQFTYLQDSRARVDVVLGDGRLSLEREPGQRFDTLILDAFSGDSIPVHLLTEEAFRCYYRHLAPGGILAVHVSSDFVDLRPVVADLAAASSRRALLVQSAGSVERQSSRAAWILVSENREFLREVSRRPGAEFLAPSGRRPWTDQFSNVLSVLR